MYIKKKYFINISIAAIITTSPNLALAELTSQQMDSIFECTSLLASSMNQSLNYELEFAGDDPEFNEASLQIFDKWQGFMMNFQDISESQNAAVEKHIEYLSESVPAFETGYLTVNRDRSAYRDRFFRTFNDFSRCTGNP